jgi:hypothetical protein
MKNKKNINEGVLKWIPGTKEFDSFAKESMKKHKSDRLSYNKEKLDELETLWRDTIKKANKNWQDNRILSSAGVWTEKDLEKLMDELKKTYLSDAEPVDMADKKTFVTALLKMLSILKYL